MSRSSVALFSTLFLQRSQTFIWEELRGHKRYDVDVFTRKRMNAEAFPWSAVHTLAGQNEGLRGAASSWKYAITRRSASFDKIFRERSFALVHGHFGLGSLYALSFAERFNLPLVCTFHGYDVPLLRDPRRWLNLEYARYSLYAPRLFRRMTLGLCCSNDLFQLLREYGVPAEKLAIHRLGIDLDSFQPRERVAHANPIRVMMIGRFTEKKGFEYGVRAFAHAMNHLAAQGSDIAAELVIVGDGERREQLETIASDCGVAAHVRFLGVVDNSEVSALLAGSDILLAPSVIAANGDRESGLIVAKEASACGVVPIGTYHGGIPEIIEDGSTGFLVQERDVDSLANRLELLLRDPDLRQRLGGAAREKMEREYDNAVRVPALEGLYDQAREMFAGRSL